MRSCGVALLTILLLLSSHLRAQSDIDDEIDSILTDEEPSSSQEKPQASPKPVDNSTENEESPEPKATPEEESSSALDRLDEYQSENELPVEDEDALDEEESNKAESDVYTGLSSKDDDVSRFITYIGPILRFGGNQIEYTDWIDDEHSTVKDSGFYTAPAATCFITVPPFIGQVELGFMLNFNGRSDTTIHHTYFLSRAKYAYPLTNTISATAGLGLYVESLPSSETYTGTGAIFCLGALYSYSSDWMFIGDLDIGYGNFGKGVNSNKLHYGITAGAGYKMGNL